MFSAIRAAAFNSDLVISVGNDTYLCILDPSKVDRSTSALPITKQNVWQIAKYSSETEIDGENSIDYVHTKYPNGNTGYDFAADSYDTYTYEYRM